MASRRNLMRVAMEEAGRSLRSFGVKYTEPIDVFKIIHEKEIELIFRPLEGRVDGFYIPPTGKRKAGVLLNSRRPLSRKRYTAAHELCHFLRKDTAGIRVETMSEDLCAVRQGNSDDETLADFFAAHFLMPPKLITQYYKRLDLKSGPLAPSDVYLLSLCMCTSYRATCNQLANLEFIPQDNHLDLIRIEPRQIKAQWAEKIGHRDIWSIEHKMSGLTLMSQVEDTIRVILPETPSTGYVWESAMHNGEIVKLESTSLTFPGPDEIIGQSGDREIVFTVQETGKVHIDIQLRRPWEREESAIDNFNLQVVSTNREFNGHYIAQLQPIAA